MIDIAKYWPWAVIAGGSEGVGAELAVQLAEAGLNLVLLARKPGPLEATAERVRANGVEVRTLSVDLTEADVLDKIRTVTDDLEVGLLVYNAGANTYGHEFVTGDLDRFRRSSTSTSPPPAEVDPALRRADEGTSPRWPDADGLDAGHVGVGPDQHLRRVKSFCRTFAEGLWLEMREYDVDVLEMVLGCHPHPGEDRPG